MSCSEIELYPDKLASLGANCRIGGQVNRPQAGAVDDKVERPGKLL
jgi:hypothetical protein